MFCKTNLSSRSFPFGASFQSTFYPTPSSNALVPQFLFPSSCFTDSKNQKRLDFVCPTGASIKYCVSFAIPSETTWESFALPQQLSLCAASQKPCLA
jgi:hypothetical protein